MSEPICVIVTGLSGAGKSIAIDFFEDFGFFCVDNLPIALIPKLMDLYISSSGKYERLALGLDIRAGEQLSEFFDKLQYLTQTGYKYNILFLESSDEVLIRRFSATRRKHPLGGAGTIQNQIHQEREKLQDLKKRADCVIDTSNVTPQALRNTIAQMFLKGSDQQAMVLTLVTFGYKNGLPMDADLVFDVRFLPNPFYEPELRHLTGDDPAVIDYLKKSPLTAEFLKHLFDMMGFLIPCYIQEGKSYLTIAFGCTGGKHRSVFIANQLQEYFKSKGSDIRLIHRDIGKE